MEIKEDFAFKCDFCEKAFFTKQILLLHEKSVHKSSSFKAKVFVCEMCSMSFTMKLILKNHINKVHKNVRKYKCDPCEKLFKTRNCIEVLCFCLLT